MAAQDFAAGVAVGNARPQYAPSWNPLGHSNVWQTGANIVWQGTTSNATYCSAANVLELS